MRNNRKGAKHAKKILFFLKISASFVTRHQNKEKKIGAGSLYQIVPRHCGANTNTLFWRGTLISIKSLANMQPSDDCFALSDRLVETLRSRPSEGGIRNALQHMWGYVKDVDFRIQCRVDSWSSPRLMQTIHQRVKIAEEPYLLQSTALGELNAWIF